MKEKRKQKKTSDNMFMLLAEDARTINTFGSTGPAGQQIFMERFSHTHSKEDEELFIDELTK